MSDYIYGEWRGLPAREHSKTAIREFYRDGIWQGPLGLGYYDEFRPWPDQADSDPMARAHHR